MATKERTPVDPDVERRLAADLFNHVWTLLDKTERTPEENDELVHAAHASGRAEPALAHAQRCLELCEAHGIGDFDIAYAYESLARAHAVGGDRGEAARYRALAEEAAAAVGDDEDRELVRQDLATL